MFKLDDCVTYIASNALKEISEKLNDILVGKGSTRVQWIALYYISLNHNINQSDLSRKMNVKTPTMVKLIDRLEKEGLVMRTADKNNRRIVQLSLTDKGIEINKILLPIGDTFSKTISSGISDDELKIFYTVLNKLVKNLPRIDEKI
jgi:DNA-binding MarR family transcriptional regulator